MSAAASITTCRDVLRLLGPYFDGELGASDMLEVDEHVSICGVCSERIELLRATRGTLKQVTFAPAPDALRNRIAAAMTAERARSETRAIVPAKDVLSRTKVIAWRAMVPLAGAAALALFWGVAARGPAAKGKELREGAANDVLADLVAEHSQPMPPEHTDPGAVRNLEKYVGVPVHPSRFERSGAKLVGGRVVPMHQQRAAMIQYVVGSGQETRRVSGLIYNPQKIAVTEDELTPRSIGTANLRVGTVRGYSVAVSERGGVGYAFVSDLDPDQMAEFAAAAQQDELP